MNLPNKPKVLAATYNPASNTKMISFLVDFPTVLLAELRTHRILTQGSLYEHSELIDFNLSANSARAIPHNKYLEKVLNNPFVPIWTKQQKGMSGGECNEKIISDANCSWVYAFSGYSDGEYCDDYCVIKAYNNLVSKGVHKQNANRLLAPFAYTTCIITGTEFENFFSLRCPQYEVTSAQIYKSKKEACKATPGLLGEITNEIWWQSINKSTAQPEFQIIAEMLYDLYQEANWKESKYHIPFESDIYKKYNDDISLYLQQAQSENTIEDVWNLYMKVSASMCAKLSYNTQDNEDTLEKHLERANMLIEHKHSEPFSHQAVAMLNSEIRDYRKVYKSKHFPNIPKKELVSIEQQNNMYLITEYGWCYNNRGFISQRYILENLT